MRFIPVEKAKSLKVGVPVYTLDANGNYGYGKLNNRVESVKGVEFTFEMASFVNPALPPSLTPDLATNIEYIAILKPKAADDGND